MGSDELLKGANIPDLILAFLLISVSAVVFNCQPTNASGTITINADGTVSPATAPIQRNGDIYNLTGYIYQSIEIKRNNTILDGSGYVVQGGGSDLNGIYLNKVDNITVGNLDIKTFSYGVNVYGCSNILVHRNRITNTASGSILGDYCGNITIIENILEQSSDSRIGLSRSPKALISGNRIYGRDGFYVSDSPDCTISGNELSGTNETAAISLTRSSASEISNNRIVEYDRSIDN